MHEKVKVEIEFLGRGVDIAKNHKHWAVLLKNEKFFCTIEYGMQGIVIQYFKRDRSIEDVCAAMMGQNRCVAYNDNYQTSMTYAEILEYINSTKSSWNSGTFNGVKNNCRHYIRVLGKKLNSSFTPPLTKMVAPKNCPGQIDNVFPKERIIA